MTINLPDGSNPSEIIDPAGNQVSEVRDADGNVVWQAPDPAYFDMTITGTNSPVDEGQTLEVSHSVTNTGDEEGTGSVDLYVNNDLKDFYEHTLSPGETQTGTTVWNTQEGDAGDYTAEIEPFNVDGSTDSTPVSIEVGTTVVDDYEHNALSSHYVGDTGSFEVTTNEVLQGSYSMRAPSQYDSDHLWSDPASSYITTPQIGDTFEFYFSADQRDAYFITGFCSASTSNSDNLYSLYIRWAQDADQPITFRVDENGNTTTTDFDNAGLTGGSYQNWSLLPEWNRITVETADTGSAYEFTVTGESGITSPSDSGTEVVPPQTATDSGQLYASGELYHHNTYQTSHTTYWDNWRIL